MSSTSAPSTDDVLQRVAEHSFFPVDNGFTVDPDTGHDGVSDAANTDWRVRTTAVRDLVRLGPAASDSIADALTHDNPHVRQVGTMALGIRRAETAVKPLTDCLQTDPEPYVRAHAALALGQIGHGEAVVEAHLEAEEHPDVCHQCRLALDRIQKGAVVEPDVAERFAALDDAAFGRVEEGDPAPDFELEDTEGQAWRLSEARGKTVVLLWIFADWCPVCHKEFHQLIERADRFWGQDIEVATLECHDRYRCRAMVGKEGQRPYWFADHFDGHPQDPYPEHIWWPHLVDRAAAVGARYGIDPWEFAVHSEWVNRPTTVIIDPEGTVRLAYFGDYWGDRPSIGQILQMIESGTYEFEAPPPRRGPH